MNMLGRILSNDWPRSRLLAVLLSVPMPVWAKVLVGLIPLAMLGASVYVLIQRIKEIRSGEEDDLSQY